MEENKTVHEETLENPEAVTDEAVCEEAQAGKSAEASQESEASSAEEAAKAPEEAEHKNPLEELTGKVQELTDRLLRNMAEFDNYRKRTTKEKSQSFELGVRHAVEAILPVMDNFERALGSAANQEDPLYKGLQMTYDQMLQALKSLGVTPIEDLGCTFDPHIHEAMQHIEDEAFGEQEVVEVYRKGYRLGGTLIRASLVKVAN